MKRYISLKVKLIIPLIIILILVFFASSLVIIERESNAAKETIINRAESYASLSVFYLIKNFELYYESGFYKFIEITDETMSLNEDIDGLQILNINGKILFDSNEIINGKYDEQENGERYIDNPEIIEKIGFSTATTIEYENSLDIIQPYIEEWGRHDYSIRYFVTLSNLKEMINEMYITVFLYSVDFILISFFLIYFLMNRFITSPLGKLREGVKMMSKGKLGFSVELNSKDEIGDLAKSFNQMSNDLNISRKNLEEYSKNLEKQVKDRTKELSDKTKNLELINKDLNNARKELHKMNKNLEKKVKARTSEVEMLLKQKDEFINQLGHDLKTPLGPLVNLIPLLEEKETDPKRKEILSVLHNDVDYMKNLVVKTLDLARLNSPKTKFSYDEINVTDVIKHIIENKKSLSDEKNIKINNKINNNIIIMADKQQFQELFTNIIENAIKYNKINGKIIIGSEEINDNIILSIKDTGIGLKKDHIDHIFDEFYKADNSRHDFESSGLGLSICKRIVEKHNGKIWVSSPGIDKGTTIFIQLPKKHK